ncbi:MAG: discoidin domain-containing protein [Spirochaetota bacterium]
MRLKITILYIIVVSMTMIITIFVCNYHERDNSSKNNDIKGKNKISAWDRLICHEDYWVEQVEKDKDKIFASSTLNSRYTVDKLFDGKLDTCWCPAGDGIGEFIIMQIPYGIKGVKIVNGLAASEELFKKNNRVKEVVVGVIAETYYPSKGVEEYDVCKNKYTIHNMTFNIRKIRPILKDTMEEQSIYFDKYEETINFYKSNWDLIDFKRSKKLYLVIGIESIYKGSTYNDTCISEIRIIE